MPEITEKCSIWLGIQAFKMDIIFSNGCEQDKHVKSSWRLSNWIDVNGYKLSWNGQSKFNAI